MGWGEGRAKTTEKGARGHGEEEVKAPGEFQKTIRFSEPGSQAEG